MKYSPATTRVVSDARSDEERETEEGKMENSHGRRVFSTWLQVWHECGVSNLVAIP